jgi:DHA2 family multidrug resistance protein
MMRNLGGAFGIAGLQTLLTKREQFHSNVLTQRVSPFAEAARTRIDGLTGYFLSHGISDRAAAAHEAIVAIGRAVQKQSFILAFSDTFFLMGAALILALVAGLLLKRPDHVEAGGGH